MPVDWSKYPRDWASIRVRIRTRAGERCECRGECGDHTGERCAAPNGATIRRDVRDPARWAEHHGCSLCLGGDPECRPVRVVLTVAHLDHDTTNNDEANLRALCQRCHLKMDAAHHAGNARRTRAARKAIGSLPGVGR